MKSYNLTWNMGRLCPISLVTATSRCGLLSDGWPITDPRAWQGSPPTAPGPGGPPQRRRGRGQQRVLHPELKNLIEGLTLRKPPPTIALVHRQVVEVARRNG